MVRLLVQRFVIVTVLSIVFAISINELTFLFMKSPAGRAPETIELVIPAGTADLVAKGEPVPAIPANMTFVSGDTLVVRNEDSSNHRLGPLFIPTGSSASLLLSEASVFAYQCSFQNTKVFGIDVQEPVTSYTRFYGILLGGLPLGMLLGVYSLLVWPLKKKETVTP